MPKYDLFIISLRSDLRKNGLTLVQAADKVDKGFRQFTRELRGETARGIMPVETVAALRREGIITADTVDAYWQGIRSELNFKKEKDRLKAAR